MNPDVYIYLDRGNFVPYIITIKLNVTIQVNPFHYTVESFLAELTNNILHPTNKCKYHGDEDTGLKSSTELEKLLKPAGFPLQKYVGNEWGFTMYGRTYKYFSIGVAANPKYAAVSTRQGNDCENKSSHFEIKFKRVIPSGEFPAEEYLCLNIHLLGTPGTTFGKPEVINRLDKAIRFFYHELGLLRFETLSFHTNFRGMFEVTLNNHKSFNIDVKHPLSVKNLAEYKSVSPYLSFKWNRAITKPPAPKVVPTFVLLKDDFPSL